MLLGAILLTLAIFSHSAHDFTVIQGGSDEAVHNWIGEVGAYFACTMSLLFGLAVYPFVILLLICAIRPFFPFGKRHKGRWIYLPLTLFGLTLLLAVYPQAYSETAANLGLGYQEAANANLSGGAIGQVLAAPEYNEVEPGLMRRYMGVVGTILLASALTLGGLVAIYTTYDAYGIRATADPFTFLAWFFFLDGLAMPTISAVRWRKMAVKPDLGPLAVRGVLGGLIAFGSFGAIMLATRLDKVGEAAVLRETSTVFAAAIGWIVLGEKVGPRRIGLMSLIALGAIIVEFGG